MACVIWTGATDARGYGYTHLEGQRWWAHRLAYTQHVGPIPAGHCVHHSCGVKGCVNPAHLTTLPKADHHRLHNPRPATCRRGHSMADALGGNVSRRRMCRTCHNTWRQRKAGK